MKEITIQLEDTFYNDLEACALHHGYASINECFVSTMTSKVEEYRLHVASESIDKSDFPSVPVVSDERGEQ